MQRRPSEYPADAFASLATLVPCSTYRRFDDQRSVPSAISRLAGEIASGDYRTVLVTHGIMSSAPRQIAVVTPAGLSSAYSITVFRADTPGSETDHFNRDEIVLFQDAAGKCWQAHTKDVPGHVKVISRDSRLSEMERLYHIPPGPSGPLTSLTHLYGTER